MSGMICLLNENLPRKPSSWLPGSSVFYLCTWDIWWKLPCRAYTAMMDEFCKGGRSPLAMELLNEALEMRLTPNAVPCYILFDGFAKEGRPVKGSGVLKLMKWWNSFCLRTRSLRLIMVCIKLQAPFILGKACWV